MQNNVALDILRSIFASFSPPPKLTTINCRYYLNAPKSSNLRPPQILDHAIILRVKKSPSADSLVRPLGLPGHLNRAVDDDGCPATALLMYPFYPVHMAI